ncbi:MAG: hypothetical protein WBB45_09260 [Cyclobacteriaceae bacterium]
MNKVSATILLFLLSNVLKAQELTVGLGISLDEKIHYETPIVSDTLVIYNNPQNRSHSLIPKITYAQPLTERVDMSIGFQYFRNYIGYIVEKRATDSTYENIKVTNAGIRSFEFPIAGTFVISKEKDFALEVFAGVIPVLASVDFEPIYKEGPQYPASVAEALNKAGTLPKHFYMDYLAGGRVSYKRFNVDVYYHSNLTSNLNNNLEIWGSEFLFKRNTESVRLILSYSIPLFRK